MKTKLQNYLETMEKVKESQVDMQSVDSGCNSTVANSIYTGKPDYVFMSVEEHAKIKAQLHGMINLIKNSRESSPEIRLILAEQLFIELHTIEQVFYPEKHNLFHSPQVRFLRSFYEEVSYNVRDIIKEFVAL